MSLIINDGAPAQARGSYVFSSGDEVQVLTEPDYTESVRRLFEGEEREHLN